VPPHGRGGASQHSCRRMDAAAHRSTRAAAWTRRRIAALVPPHGRGGAPQHLSAGRVHAAGASV